MKVLTGRSGCLGKGALRRKAKRRRGLPANVPCGVEDSYSALPPATAAAEEIVEPEKGRATGEGEGTGAEGAQKSMKEEAR